MGKKVTFPSVCKHHALLYRVVLFSSLTGALLNRDYSHFLLGLFLLLEVQEGICKKRGSRRRSHVHAGSLRRHRTHGQSSQEFDKTLWERSSLSRIFERISRISGTTSPFSHVSQRLGLKFSLSGWPAVVHTHPPVEAMDSSGLCGLLRAFPFSLWVPTASLHTLSPRQHSRLKFTLKLLWFPATKSNQLELKTNHIL